MGLNYSAKPPRPPASSPPPPRASGSSRATSIARLKSTRNSPRSAGAWLLLAVLLVGCAAPPVVIYRCPEPPELLMRAPRPLPLLEDQGRPPSPRIQSPIPSPPAP